MAAMTSARLQIVSIDVDLTSLNQHATHKSARVLVDCKLGYIKCVG